MEIPKIITKKKHKYIFVKKCNNNIFLYKEKTLGYSECFSRHELNMVKATKKEGSPHI